MDPLGKLQVAVKNSIDVLYFSCTVPFFALCAADGNIGEPSSVGLSLADCDLALSVDVLFFASNWPDPLSQPHFLPLNTPYLLRRSIPPSRNPLPALPLSPSRASERNEYLSTWKDIAEEAVSSVAGVSATADVRSYQDAVPPLDTVPYFAAHPTSQPQYTHTRFLPGTHIQTVTAALLSCNIFLVAKRAVDDGRQERCYFACKLINGVVVLLEVTFQAGSTAVQVAIKTTVVDVVAEMQQAIESVLQGVSGSSDA